MNETRTGDVEIKTEVRKVGMGHTLFVYHLHADYVRADGSSMHRSMSVYSVKDVETALLSF